MGKLLAGLQLQPESSPISLPALTHAGHGLTGLVDLQRVDSADYPDAESSPRDDCSDVASSAPMSQELPHSLQ